MGEYNIKHIEIATGSPQANGQVERVNRILGPMIAKLTDIVFYLDKRIYSTPTEGKIY